MQQQLKEVALAGGRRLSISEYEVTRAEWQLCVKTGPSDDLADDNPALPMTGINHLDVETYLIWLNSKGGQYCRLLTAMEWQ